MKLDKKQIFGRITIALGTDKAADIAKMFGLTAGAVSQWKHTGNISLDSLQAVSLSSGFSIHWLVTGEGPKEIETCIKPLALVRPLTDTAGSKAPNTIPAYDSASLPLVGRIDQQQLTATEGRMTVPAILVYADSNVIQITGDGWASEGLQHGDLLIVQPVNGTSVENRIVVASLPGNRAIVRRFSRAGELVALAPLAGGAPVFRLPAEDVQVRWIVTSITHQL